jgi:mono/diheme cytochrome c family protein
MRLEIAFVFSIWVALAGFRFVEAAESGVDFVRDIQPIFKSRCYACHGPEKQKGALRLDSRKLALDGGSNGPLLIPGDSVKSYIMQRVRGEGDESRMPEKVDALTPRQIQKLAAWIDAGAVWPESASVAVTERKTHWAYQRPVKPPVPDSARMKNGGWVRNPVDAFILARLEKEAVTPAPEASKETLVRRLSLDLTGVPPTLEEVAAFVADTRPDAYERLVDRLLASPRFGERMAVPWLDLARYADTDGFNFDTPREMWTYRDWVINAYNSDLSFKEFTLEQIAGDLLPHATTEQRIAAGFHRNTMRNTEGGVDPEEARWETLLDRTNTTASVWLGSTLGCAQCHNHKYDPFSQKDYYSFLAFFDNCDEITIEAKSGEVVKPNAKKDRKKRKEAVKALEKAQAAEKAGKNLNEAAPPAEVADAGAGAEEEEGAADDDSDYEDATALVFRERKGLASTDLRVRGAFTSKGERMGADVPKFLPELGDDAARNRLGLAQWLVSPQNPLTARVTVNRYWQMFIGRGLVHTLEDFGTQGEAPSHPELLDWLAVEFMDKGWSTKAFVKMLAMSATYRQSSRISPAQMERDPFNILCARGARRRLDAEFVRDDALAISGLLSEKIGGPSVFPPAPDASRANNKVNMKWIASPGADRYRRGLYTYARRTAPFAMFTAFDGPSREFCTILRARTNTPMQALTGLNDPASFEFAQAFARRIVAGGGASGVERLRYAFELCTARAPSAQELATLEKAFAAELAHFEKDAADANAVAGGVAPSTPAAPAAPTAPAELAAWTMIANVLLNMDETITRE